MDIELEAIIDEMGDAMRAADRSYVARMPYGTRVPTTSCMETVLLAFSAWAARYEDVK